MIKLANKTSNIRATVTRPPKDWAPARKREYLEWAHEVAEGCRGVNPRLEAWFDEAYAAAMKTLL